MAGGGFSLLILGFIESVLSKVMFNGAHEFYKKITPLTIFPKKSYKNRLKARVHDMPFLYKSLNLSIKNDYVDSCMFTISTTKLNRLGTYSENGTDLRNRFIDTKKAIILADGGFGKTTLFYKLISSIVSPESGKNIFQGGEKLLPIYVQLKAINISDDHPILSAIQNSDQYFHDHKGYKRFISLAKNKRLLLLFDGYDEMPTMVGSNIVQEELSYIFGDTATKNSLLQNSSFQSVLLKNKSFYDHISLCRCYLTSRKEYFDIYPVKVSSLTPYWSIDGMNDRKIKLVDNIFTYYKSTNKNLNSKKLNSELFMQELNYAKDVEIVNLSQSPLFLTVICYVYVNDIIEYGEPKVFLYGAYDTVHRCIQLLLNGLDEYKYQDLSGLENLAAMNRRSAFVKEKIGFLEYFSTQSYADNLVLFRYEDLVGYAKKYFTVVSSSSKVEEITRNLDNSDMYSNLVGQIILSGMFVLIDKDARHRKYDFPHRRFKEALAVSKFNSPIGAEELSSHFDNLNYSELILTYVKQSEYSELIIDNLVKHVQRKPGKVSTKLLEGIFLHNNLIASKKIFSFIEGIDVGNSPVFSSELLYRIPKNPEYIKISKLKLDQAISVNDYYNAALWSNVYGVLSEPSLEVFDKYITSSNSFKVSRILFFSKMRPNSFSNNPLLLFDVCANESDGAQAIFDIDGLYINSNKNNELLKHEIINSFIKKYPHFEFSNTSEVFSEYEMFLQALNSTQNHLAMPFTPWNKGDGGH